jgi:ketosteroid isomerase-like protein
MKPLRILRVLVLPLFLALTLAPGQRIAAGEDDPRTARLQAADDARVAATVAADRAKLSAILSDDLHYAHASGNVDTKNSYIETVTSGRTKYMKIDYQERQFTFPAPRIALMTGKAHIQVAKPDGTTADMPMSYLGVWREENNAWHFLAWQSAKLPDAAATPVAK